MIAHALCTIGNVRYGRQLDAERAALVGLYHDAAEIMTGDLPTPVKYGSDAIRDAYKAVERNAEEQLLARLPEDLRQAYEGILTAPEEPAPEEQYLRRLVKAADKLSALIKCIEERNSGNQEFRSAEASTRESLGHLAEELPEVRDFVRDFLPAYGKTLDELTKELP